MQGECTTFHRKEYEEAARIGASAPGSLHILGEHIEFSRGRVMSLALPLRACVTLSSRDDGIIRIFAANYNERKRFSLSNLKFKKEDRWANLIKGILHGLDNLGCALTGLNITIWSEIPEGKGLGASSAIGMAAALALVKHFRFSLSDAQVVYLVNTTETQFLGKVSSLASCFVSFHAHAGALFVLDLRTQEYRHLRQSMSEFVFWVLDTMVPPTGAKDEIADRRNLFEKLKASLKSRAVPRYLRDMPLRDAVQTLEDIPEDQRRLGLFIIHEEDRLGMAEDSVEASNIPPLGKILCKSHEGLRDQYEISCPELDWLVKHGMMQAGVLGGRLSGRGLGGCMVFLAKGEVEFAPFLAEYERIFGFQARLFRAVPSHKASYFELPSGENP